MRQSGTTLPTGLGSGLRSHVTLHVGSVLSQACIRQGWMDSSTYLPNHSALKQTFIPCKVTSGCFLTVYSQVMAVIQKVISRGALVFGGGGGGVFPFIHTGRGRCTNRTSQGVDGQVWKWLISLPLTFHWPDPSHRAPTQWQRRLGNVVFLCMQEERAELVSIRLVPDRQLFKPLPLNRV